MDHPTAHWDRVPQDFVGEIELLEGVNAACREREVDRATADGVAGARIGPPLKKIDFVAASPEETREETAGEAAADEGEFCAHAECYRGWFRPFAKGGTDDRGAAGIIAAGEGAF
jgi:hypothetical protein